MKKGCIKIEIHFSLEAIIRIYES